MAKAKLLFLAVVIGLTACQPTATYSWDEFEADMSGLSDGTLELLAAGYQRGNSYSPKLELISHSVSASDRLQALRNVKKLFAVILSKYGGNFRIREEKEILSKQEALERMKQDASLWPVLIEDLKRIQKAIDQEITRLQTET